jgi:FtsP/CotA-like multicopper oxidase with cupredoxin domain
VLGVGAPFALARAQDHAGHDAMGGNTVVGQVDHSRNGFDPATILTDFDYGAVTTDEAGRTIREWVVTAVDREIEIAPGVFFPAWTFNGQVPGPTIRATEGDRLRITFTNAGSHPHTMHFHGWHPPEMDGSMPEHQVMPGGRFVYEFDAEPFGMHLYHCHAVPLKRHIHKGLYGVFIVDPRTPRPEADELIMMMNGFDTNFDADNEVYAVNTVANFFMNEPIKVEVGTLVRMYLANVTEFDLVNSLHLHGMFFDVFRTGTALTTTESTDTIMLCQGERAVLETRFRYPGKFMFHAHQSEFAELGWMGLFEAVGGRRDT